LKKAGLYTGAAALGGAGLHGFIDEFRKPMSRRTFLKLGLKAAGIAGAAAILGATPEITETPPKTALKKSMETQGNSDDDQLEKLRDPKLAEALQQLSKAGYKKIAFIYGTEHLKRVEEYLNAPEKGAREIAEGKEVIERNNPDVLHVYHLSEEDNHSEKFVASYKKVWKRIPLTK
jgi:hypothetical protein